MRDSLILLIYDSFQMKKNMKKTVRGELFSSTTMRMLTFLRVMLR